MSAILQRIDGKPRASINFELDGASCTALEGDTLLTAILTQTDHLRRAEPSGSPRAGFCMMGACQDCWVLLADGQRLRACTTFVAAGMRVRSGLPT